MILQRQLVPVPKTVILHFLRSPKSIYQQFISLQIGALFSGCVAHLVEFLEEDAKTACVVGREEGIGKTLGLHFCCRVGNESDVVEVARGCGRWDVLW